MIKKYNPRKTFYIPQALFKILQQRAAAESRTVSNYVQLSLKKSLENK